MGGKILRIARTKLKEKNKVEGLMLSDFKTYIVAVIKTYIGLGLISRIYKEFLQLNYQKENNSIF